MAKETSILVNVSLDVLARLPLRSPWTWPIVTWRPFAVTNLMFDCVKRTGAVTAHTIGPQKPRLRPEPSFVAGGWTMVSAVLRRTQRRHR